MKSRVIFASLVLGLGLTISQAGAATTTNTDDSPAAKKPASTMLVNGSQKLFASYVEQHVARFATTTNWQNFMSVITSYNDQPAAVLNISPADRAAFNEGAAQVINELAKVNEAEAAHWMGQANHTTRMINFIWNVNLPSSEVAETPEIQ